MSVVERPDLIKPSDATNVATVFQGALSNFRAEAAADLNNAGFVRNVFGVGQPPPAGQDSWLDNMLGRVSIGSGSMDPSLASAIGDSGLTAGFVGQGTRNLTGDPTLTDIGNQADNIDGSSIDTGSTDNLGYLMGLRQIVDQLKGKGKADVLARLNNAIGQLQQEDATKALANSLGDGNNPAWLAKNFTPQTYLDYLKSLQKPETPETTV